MVVILAHDGISSATCHEAMILTVLWTFAPRTHEDRACHEYTQGQPCLGIVCPCVLVRVRAKSLCTLQHSHTDTDTYTYTYIHREREHEKEREARTHAHAHMRACRMHHLPCRPGRRVAIVHPMLVRHEGRVAARLAKADV